MTRASATIVREIDLVRAYLAIVRLRPAGGLDYTIDAPADAIAVRMPPMKRLPLVDYAIASGPAISQTSGSIRIRAAFTAGMVRLEIATAGTGFLPGREGEAVTGIRECLAALYGGDARLVLRGSAAAASEALVELPFEPLARGSNASLGATPVVSSPAPFEVEP